MINAGLIFVSTESKEQALEIAQALIISKLAACASATGPVTSTYFWDDKVNQNDEYLLIIKCLEANYQQIEIKIKELHSYSNPEIIYTPVTKGSDDYLQWIKSVTN